MQKKEAIYDTKIFPLMREILETCKAHKIAMVASFDLRSPDNDNLFCTSALVADEFSPPEHFVRAWNVLYPRHARKIPRSEDQSHGG